MSRSPLSYHADQVYPIREDTSLLLEAARSEVRSSDCVLEVGTGSGHIAAELRRITPNVVATDINPHAVRMAKEKGVEVVRTDLVAGLCATFDLIVFNPPYLPTRKEERIEDWLERALDGGPSGREVIERFVRDIKRVLAPEGRILLCISSLTGIEAIQDLILHQGFHGRIVQSTGIGGEELLVVRLTWTRSPSNSSPS
jgi:release factor glutamine methyltransferase